jgi:hypothetical protein
LPTETQLHSRTVKEVKIIGLGHQLLSLFQPAAGSGMIVTAVMEALVRAVLTAKLKCGGKNRVNNLIQCNDQELPTVFLHTR